jgi:hypothetical protein
MKRWLTLVAALAFVLALYGPHTQARSSSSAPVPQDQAEADAYKAWYDANAAKDYVKAMELAKAYVQKFPSGKYADYLKKTWMPSIRGYFYKQAADAKNVSEVIRIGNEVLAEDPDNLDYLLALVVQIRTNELFANPPVYTHAADAANFSERAIRLIESGKVPTGADAKFNKNVTLAYLHETLAKVHEGHGKNPDKALAQYEKAAELDSNTAGYFFNCGRIHNDKYAAAAQKYDAAQKKVDAIPEADRSAAEPKPEVKSALDEAKSALAEVNNEADAVIRCWARFLGLTFEKNTWGETRARILQAFTDLYKYRHNNSTDGMDKLIDQNKPTPQSNSGTPAASSSTAAASAKP